ncbi:hypothetical protein Asp14428_36710 [Actinoplanes sp. NBRC 14428]|nr:hypothetical protein Asp14428_36710 [Actinoplanes sp. NBRC 14428]
MQAVGMIAKWRPVIYRGDGAWIGLLASGELGVGTQSEERASLEAAGMRPMWPFMEKSLPECRDQFDSHWSELRTPAFPAIDSLFSVTISTAWNSGSQYWMLRAANWLVEFARTPGFERSILTEVRDEMLMSDLVGDELRSRIW